MHGLYLMNYPDIDMDSFIKCDWHDFYGELLEVIPPNAPEPQGWDVDIRMFMDSDHTGDKLMHHS